MGFVLENHEPQISWFKLKLVTRCFSYVLKTPRTTATVPQHILEEVTKSSEKSFTAMVLVYPNFEQHTCRKIHLSNANGKENDMAQGQTRTTRFLHQGTACKARCWFLTAQGETAYPQFGYLQRLKCFLGTA